MGKIYKRKRRSCAMCKPHKRGGADKRKARERVHQNIDEEEIARYTGNARLMLEDDETYLWDDALASDYDNMIVDLLSTCEWSSNIERLMQMGKAYFRADYGLNSLRYRINHPEYFGTPPEMEYEED